MSVLTYPSCKYYNPCCIDWNQEVYQGIGYIKICLDTPNHVLTRGQRIFHSMNSRPTTPVSPSGVSWIGYLSMLDLSELLFILVGAICVKYQTGRKFWSHKISSMPQAAHSLRSSSWNHAPWQQLFLLSSCSKCMSMHLTLWKIQGIALEPAICLKGRFLSEPSISSFSLVMSYSHKSKDRIIETHDLTDHQLAVSSFLPANSSTEKLLKYPILPSVIIFLVPSPAYFNSLFTSWPICFLGYYKLQDN